MSTTNTTPEVSAALAATADLLAKHPDVARDAMVTVMPEGTVSIQLVREGTADNTRVGLLYALAAIYTGDIVRHELRGYDHISTDLLFDGRSLRVYTEVRSLRGAL